jgi:hypothetical protein
MLGLLIDVAIFGYFSFYIRGMLLHLGCGKSSGRLNRFYSNLFLDFSGFLQCAEIVISRSNLLIRKDNLS